MVLLQQTKCAQLFCILSALATLSCIESQDIFFIPRIFRFSSDLAYPPLNFGNWVHIRVHCKCFKNFLASYKLCTTFTEINNTKRLNPKSLRKDWWKYIPSITSNSRTFIKMLKKSSNEKSGRKKFAQVTKPVIPLPIAVPALTSKGDPSSLASWKKTWKKPICNGPNNAFSVEIRGSGCA